MYCQNVDYRAINCDLSTEGREYGRFPDLPSSNFYEICLFHLNTTNLFDRTTHRSPWRLKKKNILLWAQRDNFGRICAFSIFHNPLECWRLQQLNTKRRSAARELPELQRRWLCELSGELVIIAINPTGQEQPLNLIPAVKIFHKAQGVFLHKTL